MAFDDRDESTDATGGNFDTSDGGDFGTIGGEFGSGWADDIEGPAGDFGSIGGEFGSNWADDFDNNDGISGEFADDIGDFGGISGESYDHFNSAYEAFRVGNYAYSFNQLIEGIFVSAVEYGVSFASGNVGMKIGSAFGPYGAMAGYLIGKYVGAELGVQFAEAMLEGDVNNLTDEEINDMLRGIASDNGTTPEDILKSITDGIKEDGIDNLIADLSNYYQVSSYYETGLSRRRSNIIGTGRRGLTIE